MMRSVSSMRTAAAVLARENCHLNKTGSLASSVTFLRFASSRTLDEIKLPLFARALDPKNANRIAFTDHTGQNFTYDEFGKKSAYLSKELKSLVPGQEERIAFLCDRDFSFPTTLGATWWANHVGKAVQKK